jgi:hypothetical protein
VGDPWEPHYGKFRTYPEDRKKPLAKLGLYFKEQWENP